MPITQNATVGPRLRLVTSEKAQRQPPKRRSNIESRPREYLLESEVEALIAAAKRRSRYGGRDALMILMAFSHGFRVSELCALRWDQIDLASGHVHVNRIKGGTPSVQPLRGVELRGLRALQREWPASRYVFGTERGGPMSPAGFRKMLARTGEAAKLPFPVHPHMLRHACGFKLANGGADTRVIQDYLGHRYIQHTARYTALAPKRFESLWQD